MNIVSNMYIHVNISMVYFNRKTFFFQLPTNEFISHLNNIIKHVKITDPNI